jgi:ABC-2 type transport system ATP-binding protein
LIVTRQDSACAQSKPLIDVQALTRTFGKSTAVDNVSFAINSGEICAFLGPNGAGKTTIIKMLTGLLEPSSGQILYENEEYHANRLVLKRMIGVVPQHNNIDKELTVFENLYVHGLLYKMRGKALKNAIAESMAFAGLSEHQHKASGKLSGGMKRKLVIARALLHKPKILFLDEPTVGLDPQTRRKILAFLSKINRERNCTIFLTTHYIEEAEKLSQRVIFINRGRIIAEGTAESLKQTVGRCVLDIEKEEVEQEFFADRASALQRLDNLVQVPVSIRETTLEDVFLYFTGARLNKNA